MDIRYGHSSERWQFAGVHIRQKDAVVRFRFVNETVPNDSFAQKCCAQCCLPFTLSIVCIGQRWPIGDCVTWNGVQVSCVHFVEIAMTCGGTVYHSPNMNFFFFIFSDLLQNPLIVPLKKLQTHKEHDDFGVFDVVWHPTQPWLFSSGADSTIRLYT